MRKWLLMGAVCFLTAFGGNGSECLAEEVEQQVILEGVESGAGVPEEMMVEYEGMEEYVPVKSARMLREYWSEDFEFPVLFYVYDAEYYELGEYRIPRREEQPGLEGHEKELLRALGLDGEDYVIEEVVWNGDAYQNEEGIWCRDASARGRKRVRDYEVVYGKEMESVEEPALPDPGEMQLMVDAQEQVERVVEPDTTVAASGTTFWKIVKHITILTVTAGLVFLLLFLLCLLFLRLSAWLRDRKKEKREKKRKDLFDYWG